MTEDENCKPPQSPRSSTKRKKKKKKRKKVSAENTEKPHAVSLPPETLLVSLLYPQSPAQPRGQLPKLRATSKDRERLVGSGKTPPKDSPSLLTETNNNSGSGSPEQGYAAELSTQARESLRWEGVLEDTEAEEKRLELYKVNRRQRYISHREAVVKETQKD